MKITFYVVVVCCLLSKVVASQSSYERSIKEIANDMEFGHLVKAETRLQKLAEHSGQSMLQKYQVSKLLSKVYLMQQNFTKFSVQVDQSIHISGRLHPIYQAEALANKAYYWHYMMWPDSALVYSNRSMQLYRSNDRFRTKIDIPFIYEVYAITFLYRRDGTKPKSYLTFPIDEFKKLQFQWFDSAVYYQSKFPFTFSTERSMLYRSYANRWLDIVAGAKKSKPTNIQLIAFNRANALYDKGIACLKSWHKNDLLTLTGLKGAIHTYIHRYREADEIFNRVIHRIGYRDLFDRTKVDYQPIMVMLSFQVRNTFFLPFNARKINQELALLHQLKPEFWKSFDVRNDLPYDPYRTSPYINLFYLYMYKFAYEKYNQADFRKAVSYLLTLKVYFHFLDPKFRNRKQLPFFNVTSIQKRLNKDACYLLMQSDGELLFNRKILITKDNIRLVRSNTKGALEMNDYIRQPFKDFQRMSYSDYQSTLKEVLTFFPTAKKIYISYDEKTPYELLVKDTLGHTYADANFVSNRINFVRLYNPYTYFGPEKEVANNRMDVRFLKQSNTSKLLFMDDLFRHFKTTACFTRSQYQGNLKELLAHSGTLHLYGHGEFVFSNEALTYGFQMRYQTANTEKSERQIEPEFECKRDLVVLNNCFSGYPFYNVNEFNRTIPLRILSNGAKAVICSPNKTDDYFSAEFFKSFYAYLDQHLLFEDAFFRARLDFFQKHPEMRNPQIWNGLQMTVSYAMKQKEQEMNFAPFESATIIAVSALLLVLLGVYWRKKK